MYHPWHIKHLVASNRTTKHRFHRIYISGISTFLKISVSLRCNNIRKKCLPQKILMPQHKTRKYRGTNNTTTIQHICWGNIFHWNTNETEMRRLWSRASSGLKTPTIRRLIWQPAKLLESEIFNLILHLYFFGFFGNLPNCCNLKYCKFCVQNSSCIFIESVGLCVRLSEAPFVLVLLLYRHCPNSFRPPPLCQTG